jgi:very-short-patch-repair endonuclease
MQQYNKLSDSEKRKLLVQEYEQNKKSFQDIAKENNTYANKIRRDAIKLNIAIRDKSEAQKNALNTGKINHPTKGKIRPEQTKQKIGNAVLKSWESMSDTDLKKRKLQAKINWDNKTDDEKALILREANTAVREASKKGSKLEIFLFNKLLEYGYSVDFHKEQSILNTKLQIDLFLPRDNIAIEVDGPSHFEPVWGNDALKRNKKYDNTKTGLIIGKGLFLIRIKQSRDFSKARASIIFDHLIEAINTIKQGSNSNQTKVINLGD